jgi:hypothetical protein
VDNFSKACTINDLECRKIDSVRARFMCVEIPQNQVVGDPYRTIRHVRVHTPYV